MFDTLLAFEMRKFGIHKRKFEKPLKETNVKEETDDDEDEEELEANFVRNLRKGTRKYKCMLLLQ